MKVSHKLPFLLIIYSVILTSLLFVHLWYGESKALERNAEKEVRLKMSRLQAELTNALQHNDNLEVQRELSWLSAIPEIFHIFITDETDWIIQASRFGWGGKYAPDIMPQYNQKTAQESRKNNQPIIHFSQDKQLIFSYYPINLVEEGQLRSQRLNSIFMVYSLAHKKEELLWHYWKETRLALLIAILASLGLMSLLYHLISYRVEQLAKFAQRLSASHYYSRVHLKGNDELTKLGITFNEMAKRLEQAHHDLYQQSRLYNALSETNQAIVRTKEHHLLFARICDIAVNVIGLENACVVFCNETDENGYLKIISAGNLCECAQGLCLTPPNLDESCDNLISQVWHSKKLIILNEITPDLMPFNSYKSDNCKTQSMAAFPLFQENEIIGVLNFCANEPDFFIPDRLKLFEEIINDISYAMDNLANEYRRSEIEETLRKERTFFKKIIDNIPVMIVRYEIAQQMLFVNTEFERLMGFVPDQNWQNIQELRLLFENVPTEIIWRDYKLLTCYGEIIETSWACIELEKGIQIGIGLDLTAHKKAEHSIRHLAYVDSLTNLPNRRCWGEFANKYLSPDNHSYNPNLALLSLDLNRFKTINDTRGHDVGDKLLVQVAERLKNCVNGNNMLARLGGDEFAFLLLDAEETEAAAVAQQVINVLQAPFVFDKYELKIGGSIGISRYPKDGKTLDTLYKYADIAMYHAKQEKLGYAFFESSQAKILEENVALEQGLQLAIKNEQFYLYYQPRVNLNDEKVASVEALLRWHHHEYGKISPEIFIVLAEQSNLIYDIDDWVLFKACQQINSWRKKGLDIRVAVNLSVKAFQRDNLFDQIQNTLLETGVKGEWLEIEITESAALYDLELACQVLLKLKALGIHLSIDDFGTGYSSLNYLKHLPIDSLKIDRSLIQNIEQPTSVNSKIVRSLLYLAKNLGLTVVAEGVEIFEQRIFLKELGCETAQGFYYTEAVSPDKLEELAKEFDWFKV